jgi:hypothetical protein
MPRARKPSSSSVDREKLIQAVRAGLDLPAAAAVAGSDHATVLTALECDDALGLEVRKAKAEHQLTCIASIQRAAQPRDVTITKRTSKPDGSVIEEKRVATEMDWQAARWLLQRSES